MTAKEIQKVRKRLKLSRERFAALIGVSAGSVQNWEKGKHKISPVWVEKINTLQESQDVTV